MAPENRMLIEMSEMLFHSLEGNITEVQFSKLESLLLESPSMREHYFDLLISIIGLSESEVDLTLQKQPDEFSCRLEDLRQRRNINAAPDDSSVFWEVIDEDLAKNALITDGAASEIKPAVQGSKGRSAANFNSIFKFTGALAAIVTFALILNILARWGQYSPPERRYVARLASAVDAGWEEEFNVGDDLYSGYMKLEKGYAEIIFRNGTSVIMEGPSAFSLQSDDSIFLDRGKLVARMGLQNTTFTVNTENVRVLDVGTEFGVKIESGNTELHVFEGETVLYPADADGRYNRMERQYVTANQARAIGADRQIRIINVAESSFVRKREFDNIVNDGRGLEYQRWYAYSRQLCQDPGLVAYYTFEKDDRQPDSLINQSAATRGELNGQLGDGVNDSARPAWSTGRWGGLQALSFNAGNKQAIRLPKSRRLQLAGDMTAAWWMKIDSVDNDLHIVISYGSGEVGREFNYYYSFGLEKGKYRAFHECDDDIDMKIFTRQPAITGRWVHVAIVRDARDRRYSFYIDGRLIESYQYAQNHNGGDSGETQPLIGSAAMQECYHGALAELALFNRVLSAEEINEMHRVGKPKQ